MEKSSDYTSPSNLLRLAEAYMLLNRKEQELYTDGQTAEDNQKIVSLDYAMDKIKAIIKQPEA